MKPAHQTLTKPAPISRLSRHIAVLGLLILPTLVFGGNTEAQSPAKAIVAYVWSDKPLARTGETIRFSAFVENGGGADAAHVTVKASSSSDALDIANPVREVARIEAGAFERVNWGLTARRPGTVQIEASAQLGKSAPQTRTYRILVLDAARSYTRQEVGTDDEGYWRTLEKPSTLQENNPARLTPIRHKKSSEIKHNTYGVSMHLPRAKDYEDPFNPAHLIDNDPETCWSSQQRPSSYPGNPPWVEIDLGRAAAITQVNLIPYWHNSGFPLGFTISVTRDGAVWTNALTVKNHQFSSNGPKRGDKIAQCFPLPEKLNARRVQLAFERVPLCGCNYAGVVTSYQARLSGIEILDEHGANLALGTCGASAKASDFFTGWQDTTASINRAFPRVLDIGLKWVRVGQWGDQTEWAAVEREKGKFALDPVTEKAIDTLLKNRVDILWGLNYGNALYERPDAPGGGDIGPIYQQGHPFCFNGGPRTEAGRQAFTRYVDFVVRKYQHRIQWWELWNEENGWYPGFEPELYGKLLYTVAKHIKEIDPNVKIMVGGTAAPAPLTTEIALREGAAPYLDACAFHPYGIDKPEGGMGTMEWHQGKDLSQTREKTGWNRVEEVIEGVRKPYARHGNTNIAVWLNEWGLNLTGLDYSYNPKVGEYAYAKYISRFYIYNGWLGHPAALWALHTENLSQDWSMIDPKTFELRPLSYAMQNACSVVSDVEPIPAPAHDFSGAAPDLKVIAYRRDSSSERLVLLWSAQLNTEKVLAYPGRFGFTWPSRPKKVLLTDLYWGLAQPAQWSYANGRVVLENLIVRDYPVGISLR
jgi:hypothetical protein